MVVTDLGGERRFAAAVAKRMAGLGALTKGDRRAATGSDLSEFDIDSRFGRRSLKRFYDCMTSDPPYAPSKTSNAILDSYISKSSDIPFHLTQADKRLHALGNVKANLDTIGIEAGSDARKNGNVKVFLNRIAALTVLAQNLIFQLVSYYKKGERYLPYPFSCTTIFPHLNISYTMKQTTVHKHYGRCYFRGKGNRRVPRVC